jgi:hypothetical protein
VSARNSRGSPEIVGATTLAGRRIVMVADCTSVWSSARTRQCRFCVMSAAVIV